MIVLAGAFDITRDYWFFLIDVVILFGIIGYFAKKAIPGFVAARRERIVADIEEARRMRDEAEARLHDYEGRLQNLETEIAEILSEARSAGEAERARILAEAETAAKRIRSDAKARLEQETTKLHHELRLKLVATSMDVAEKSVMEGLTDAHRRRFVTEYIRDLEGRDGLVGINTGVVTEPSSPISPEEVGS